MSKLVKTQEQQEFFFSVKDTCWMSFTPVVLNEPQLTAVCMCVCLCVCVYEAAGVTMCSGAGKSKGKYIFKDKIRDKQTIKML